ncbi:MAG: tetratricopeptide repeat protein, partial [Blastocatellia bacterium]|nr:tetratricopeptide repeat protein [Blastocatellia bacterium]
MTHHSEPHPVSDISDIRIRQGVRVAPRGRSERDLFLVLFLLSAALTVAPTLRAWGRTPCPVSQSPQQRRVAGNDAKDEKEVSELEPGKRIKRELAGGEQHVYQIRLNADQFLKVIVEQKGIDVVVDVLGPDGKQLQEFDTEARLQATEEVTVAAETSGEYRLIVRPVYKEATAGDYEIRIEEVRPATGDDRAMQEANKLFDEFLKLQPTGNYREEIPLLERTLEIREKILGPDHRLVLETLNALASAYFEKGDYAKAESLYRRTLAISKKLGEQNGDPATLTGLSGVYYGRGEYAESKLLLQQALAILEQALGLEHPRVAQTLFNLGIIAHERGEYAEAESLSRRALAIREKTLGPDHPDVAASLNFLAILYRNMGEYENAALFYQRSLAISEKVLGPESAPVATTLINIANLYCDRGEYAKAEPLYQRALAIIEKALGPQHRYFATTLANLAALNEMRGEYAKAEPLYQQALASFEKALGPDHPDLAGAINGLADIYRTRREYDKAEPLYERARSIREKALGPEDLKLARSLDGLADIYRARREYDKAQTLYERALSIREKALGPQHNFVAVSFGGLAKLYAAKGDLARSLDFQARANAVSERNMALNLATGSEQQKLAYLALSSIQTDFTLSLHSRYAPADP